MQNAGERRSSKYFLGTPFPHWCQDKGNGDTLAFPQISLQNAKSMVKVNSFVIKVNCLISYIVICIGESVIQRLKSNIVTALFTTPTSRCWFVTWQTGIGGHFAYGTLRLLDSLPTVWSFHLLDTSPTGHFTYETFRLLPRQFAYTLLFILSTK